MLNLQNFRVKKRTELNSLVDYMSESLEEVDKLYRKIRTLASELSTSDIAPHRIAREIVDKNLGQMDSLLLIHKSMYKINDVLNVISMEILPDLTELEGDATSVIESSKLELVNDVTFNRLTSSNAERNRETNFIFINVTKKYDKLERKYKLAKDMIVHVTNMGKYINKLDSMIRLKQSILGTYEFETMVANGTKIMNADI